jgi:hypothetical protein
MSNKVYNILKWIAMIVLPACATLYLGLSNVWGLPYGEEVSATITLVNTFLGAVLMISTNQYNKRVDTNENIK